MAIRVPLKNEEFLNEVQDPVRIKTAQDRMTGVVRLMVREGSLTRKILTPEDVTPADLDLQQDTDVPTKIVFVEPNSPAAISVGFATTSPMFWFAAKRVRATFSRYQSNIGSYDIELLTTWEMDIQQVFADNMIRDILAREDGGFFAAVNEFLGPVDVENPITGSVPHATIWGGYTRETLAEASALMLKSYYRLPPETAVCNLVTAKRLLSLDRMEVGDDMAGQLFREGVTRWRFDDLNWIFTNKLHIVPNDAIYYFANPQAIGKFYKLTDATSILRTEGTILTYWAYETISAVIANAAGLALAKIA
ncbi:MAG: hypothetical protein QXQ02_01730 [Halobacteria archaeon]